MEGIRVIAQRSVLIVDGSEENREVLTTALEHRGLRIFAARQAEEGLAMARQHRPDLILVDPDVDSPDAETAWEPLARQSKSSHTPLVVLGQLHLQGGEGIHGEFIRKPYHYGPLVRKIEELLAAS